jgi:uncharacterized protein (TIGR03083 family)
MRHTRAEVIKRVNAEYRRLDRLVSKLSAEQWRRRVPRPETKDPWTVKDVLAHITFWKWGVMLSARGERRPKESGFNITDGNRMIYKRWRRKSPREVLNWHRQVHRDLMKTLREAPNQWFTRPGRPEDFPFDADGHSSMHRVQDIERALGKVSK